MDEFELKVLKIIAKEFEYSQGLHVELQKLQKLMGMKDEVVTALESLAQQDMVILYKEKEKIKLAKITWRGLNEYGDVHLKYGLGKDYYANYAKEGY
ncbi:MAG TPA: hypothetical protein VKM55_16215 [Candidatus Lokiarchaeia archaeon]|nr:hypothetical protein [Candidatus Lokiarchaeia archaeon]